MQYPFILTWGSKRDPYMFEPRLKHYDSLLQDLTDTIAILCTEQIKRGEVRQPICEQGVTHFDKLGRYFPQCFLPGIEQGLEIPRHGTVVNAL